MSAELLRDKLAAALEARCHLFPQEAIEYADALLPVIEAHTATQADEALAAAAAHHMAVAHRYSARIEAAEVPDRERLGTRAAAWTGAAIATRRFMAHS